MCVLFVLGLRILYLMCISCVLYYKSIFKVECILFFKNSFRGLSTNFTFIKNYDLLKHFCLLCDRFFITRERNIRNVFPQEHLY